MWAIVGADNFEIARCIAVAGLFSDRSTAYRAITDLKSGGFTPEQIGFVMDDDYKDWSKEFSPNTVFRGSRSLRAGGTLASALSRDYSSNSTLAQILISLGIEPPDAIYFEKVLRTGCTLVTVESENNIVEALKILQKHGAVARFEDCS